ncbi:MAG: DUF6079 family protein [Spirochaetota bacterium]|nr:DUF6079 family protein [Spirochaetota bacterium]
MRKINELVDLPDVETVIQVSTIDAMDEDELHKSIVHSFVITKDILNALESVLFTVQRREGCGFLLKGNYGSGKSHFLAFLGALFRYPYIIDDLKKSNPELASFKRDLLDDRILPVSITLTDYPITNSLADIVTERISAIFQKEGIAGSVWDADRISKDFEEIIYPNVASQFHSYLNSKDISEFNKLSASERSVNILNFLKERDIPFRPFYDYQDIFNNIDDLLEEKYNGGIFLLIDELSEFLRARNRGDLVSEDIRFIQFLGEKAKEIKMRLVLSMQESIEEVAEVSTDGLNRIKDRYPVRINLTSVHLRELVEKRLLIKKLESLSYIDDVYFSLIDSFPEWEISKEDFRAIYPVHPATFKMLEGITGIFSKTRGMVDFIYSEIKGDKVRGIPGIMEESSDTLLYPDRIVDHFRNNLDESIEHNKIMSSIYSRFEKDIPTIFENESDRLLAFRTIKLILLFQILPGMESPTAVELANLLMEARFELDPDYNYIFIRDKILKEMELRCPFLGVKRGASSEKDRFFLQFEESPVALFESRVRQYISKNVNIKKQALWYFISSMKQKELPLASFKGDEGSVNILFENTFRQGLVYLKSIVKILEEEVENIKKELYTSESDFAIIIGFPVSEEGEEKAFSNLIFKVGYVFGENIVFWKPRIPSDSEINLLLNAYAKLMVFEKDYGSQKSKNIISEIVQEEEVKAFRIVRDLYSSGNLLSMSDGEIIQNDALLTGAFEKTAELMVRDLLKKTFPTHSRIMPSIEISSVETYNQIISIFRERGEVDFNFEGSIAIKNAVDALFRNSGLIKITQNIYRIAPDPSKNTFLKDLLFEIEQKNVSFYDLYLLFRKGKFGIQMQLFSLYLFCMAYSGFITIEKKGRSLRPERLDLKAITSSDNIKTGEGLSSLFIERYSLLEPFTDGLNAKNIHLQTQRSIWEKLIEYKRLEEDGLRRTWESLNQLKSYPLFKENPLDTIGESYERLIGFISNIRISKQSKEGLDRLLEAMGVESFLLEDLEIDKRFRLFLANDIDRVIFIYGYLTYPDIYISESDQLKSELFSILKLFKDIESLIIDSRVGNLTDRFAEFKEKYKNHYLKAHREIHSTEIIDELDRLKLTPAYRILSNLADIDTISVEDDLIRIDTIIMSAQSSLCRRSVSNELDMKPYCECKLRRDEMHIDVDEIFRLMKRGIKQYLMSINNPLNKEKILNFMGALLATGENDDRNILKEIVEINPERISDNDLLRIANPETVNLINRALSGNVKIIKREIQKLYNSIFGRRFRKNDLLKIITNWLMQDVEDESNEIIYEIQGFGKNGGKPTLPVILMDEISRVVNIDDENMRLKAFSLAWLLYPVAEARYFDIIKKVLFIDLSYDDISSSIELCKSIDTKYIDFEEFLSQDILSEVIKLLSISEMKPEELSELFESSLSFRTIRQRILELFLKEEIKITNDLKKVIRFDNSPYSGILSNFIELNDMINRYYRESGRKDQFNSNYFFRSFESLLQLEKIQWISLNNNILIDLITNNMTKLESEILRDCNEYFNKNIETWEKEDDINARYLLNLIYHSKPVLFIFDSLRADLFISLHNYLNERSVLKTEKRSFILSPYPSDTLTFRQHLFPGIELVNGMEFDLSGRKWMFINAAERDYRREEFWNLISDIDDIGIIISFPIFDEKIHSTKQGIVSLSEEVLLFCDQVFIPLLNNIPGDRKIYLTADHGFIEHKLYGEKDKPRFTHGGNSFYERVIPFAVYEKM